MVEAGFKTVDEVLVVDLVINGSKKERKKPEKFVGLKNFFSCSEICGVFFLLCNTNASVFKVKLYCE